MIRKFIIYALVFIALCCGCEKRGIDMDIGESNPVLLSANATKASSETTLESLKANGFRTLLYKNGSKKLRDEKVTWSDGYFRFAEETLWPGDGETLSVYAFYSPKTDVHIEEIDGKSVVKLFSDKKLWYNDSDICVARVENISGGGAINLPFKHIMGKISGIYVKSVCPPTKKLWFHHVLFHEPVKPCYDIRNGLWSHTGELKEKKIIAKIKTWGEEYEAVEENMSSMYLVPGKKTIEVHYNIIDKIKHTGAYHVKTVSFDVLPGNDYRLQLSINEDFVSISCISSDVQAWSSGEEISGIGL